MEKVKMSLVAIWIVVYNFVNVSVQITTEV